MTDSKILRKAIRAVILIMAMLVMSCSHYTKAEKQLLACQVVANTADIITTSQIISDGGYEMNPLLSSTPSDGELVLAGAINTGAIILLGELFPDYRAWIFGGSCVLHGGAAMWNVGQF